MASMVLRETAYNQLTGYIETGNVWLQVTQVLDREVRGMFHAGFAGELSRLMAEDRRSGSGRSSLSAGDRARIEAREASDRSSRAFESALSAGGAIGLLAIVVFGVAGAVVLGSVVALAVAAAGRRRVDRTEAVRPPEDPEGRWGVWRSVDPDPEYLRGRAA